MSMDCIVGIHYEVLIMFLSRREDFLRVVFGAGIRGNFMGATTTPHKVPSAKLGKKLHLILLYQGIRCICR